MVATFFGWYDDGVEAVIYVCKFQAGFLLRYGLYCVAIGLVMVVVV